MSSETGSAICPGAEYDPFAAVYNRWMAEDFCRRALPLIEDLVLRHLPPAARILDLCCGTGQMARALRDRGFRVTGVDASDEMLRYARRNAPDAEFLCTDARAFVVRDRFDAVISTFNSLAHVETAADLAAVFSRVRHALRTGSPFLFDLSMEEAYVSKWRGSFGTVADEHACIVRPAFDYVRRLGINQITVFEHAESELAPLYRRSDFMIVQRCHSRLELITALNNSDFRHVQSFDAQYDLGMNGEAGRSFFLCR